MHNSIKTMVSAGLIAAVALSVPAAAQTEGTAPKAPPAPAGPAPTEPTLTAQQKAAMDSWPTDRQAAFKQWPAETQAYFWSLEELRQKLFWALSDSDKVALSKIPQAQADAAWARIEAAASQPRTM